MAAGTGDDSPEADSFLRSDDVQAIDATELPLLQTSATVYLPGHRGEISWNNAAKDVMEKRACVYTSLFGGYEDLLEQPESDHSTFDFVCFTDDSDLRSDTWQVRVVSRALSEDPQRSSRYPKVCAHRFLQDYEMSMYIDNSILLKQPPEVAIEAFLPNGQAMGVFAHSFRKTVEDEFAAVMELGYEHQHVCLEQLEYYRRAHAEVLAMKPIIGGVLIRRHLQTEVVRTMEAWWRHLLNYSRRDQLSFLVAMKEAEFVPAIATVDIRDNDYWRWPASTGRG